MQLRAYAISSIHYFIWKYDAENYYHGYVKRGSDYSNKKKTAYGKYAERLISRKALVFFFFY